MVLSKKKFLIKREEEENIVDESIVIDNNGPNSTPHLARVRSINESGLVKFLPDQTHEFQFPVGCPVWYNFQYDSTSHCFDICHGIVKSVSLGITSRSHVYEVEKTNTASDVSSKPSSSIDMLSESELAYADNCPVRIQMDSNPRGELEGHVVYAKPNDIQNGHSGITYVVKFLMDGNQPRIQEGVTVGRLKYRPVEAATEKMEIRKEGDADEIENEKNTGETEGESSIREGKGSEKYNKKNGIPSSVTCRNDGDSSENDSQLGPPEVQVHVRSEEVPKHSLDVVSNSNNEDSSNEGQCVPTRDGPSSYKFEVSAIRKSSNETLPHYGASNLGPRSTSKRGYSLLLTGDLPLHPSCNERNEHPPKITRKSTGELEFDLNKWRGTKSNFRTLNVPSWVSRDINGNLFQHLIRRCKHRRLESETLCSIKLLPTKWNRGDPMTIAMASHDQNGIMTATVAIEDFILDFTLDENSEGRLLYEFVKFETGDCRRAVSQSGAVLSRTNASRHLTWMQLLDLPVNGMKRKKSGHGNCSFHENVRNIEMMTGCSIRIFSNETYNPPKLCNPYVLICAGCLDHVDRATVMVSDSIKHFY